MFLYFDINNCVKICWLAFERIHLAIQLLFVKTQIRSPTPSRPRVRPPPQGTLNFHFNGVSRSLILNLELKRSSNGVYKWNLSDFHIATFWWEEDRVLSARVCVCARSRHMPIFSLKLNLNKYIQPNKKR